MRIINKREVPVQVFNWEKFGNGIHSGAVALHELIQNGYAAGLEAGRTRVDVDIEEENGVKYLVVKNWGKPAVIERVLDYGNSSHDTAMNQHGTGFKTAMSFFNPGNDDWEFMTHDGDFVQRAHAPYSDRMAIDILEAWPFEGKDSNFASRSRVRIDSDALISDITASELGFRYALAIRDGLELNFNGKPVDPVFPCGMVMNAEPQVVTICGNQARITHTIYKLGDGNVNDPHFDMSQDTQGVYLYVNNCFAKYCGVEIFKKKADGTGTATLKKHNSMNGLIAIVNIDTPANHEADIPFDNSKSEITWDKTKAGVEYLAAINKHVGTPFRVAKANAEELGKRARFRNFIKKFLPKRGFYKEEVMLGSELRADAIIFADGSGNGTTADMQFCDKIVEFKATAIKSPHVGQAVNYWVYMNRTYTDVNGNPVNPRILLVGSGITDEAKAQAAHYEKLLKVEIEFEDWSNFRFDK